MASVKPFVASIGRSDIILVHVSDLLALVLSSTRSTNSRVNFAESAIASSPAKKRPRVSFAIWSFTESSDRDTSPSTPFFLLLCFPRSRSSSASSSLTRSRSSESSSFSSAFVVSAIHLLPVLDAESQFRFRNNLSIHRRHAVDDAARRDRFGDGHLDAKLVARHDRLQEPGFRRSEKEDAAFVEPLLRVFVALSKQQDRRLRHALDDQGAGHHGHAGKVAKEEYLVSADVLHRNDRFPLFEREHPIEHQKREFLGKKRAQLVELHAAARGCHGLRRSAGDSTGRRSTSDELMPSRLKALPMAMSPEVVVAWHVMPGSPHRGSASRKLTVGGTTCSRSVSRLAAT